MADASPSKACIHLLENALSTPPMVWSNLLSIVINAVALGFALLAIASLSLRTSEAKLPSFAKALVCLLAILAFDVASSIYDLSPLARSVPQLGGAGYVFWPWIPICLWSYVNGLTQAETVSTNVEKWQIGMAMGGSLCLGPFLLLSATDKLAIAEGLFRPTTIFHLLMALGVIIFMATWIGHMVIVLFKIVRRLASHRRRMRDLVSETSRVDLRWLDYFLLFVVIAVGTAIIDNSASLVLGTDLLGTLGAAVIEAGIVMGLALFGLDQKRAVPSWTQEAEQHAAIWTTPGNEPRYARSALSREDCEEIIVRLDATMTKAEPWRDPFLNLKTLAERIGTKPYYITQALNTVLTRNFYDYVNGWRVRAAAKLLASGEASILAICEDVGFNSKSTFNAAFRKEIGDTPSGYRRSCSLDALS